MKVEVICTNDFPWGVVLNPTPEKVEIAKKQCRSEMDKWYNCDTGPNSSSDDLKRRIIYIHTKTVDAIETENHTNDTKKSIKEYKHNDF